MRLGLGVLGMTGQEFWSQSMREWTCRIQGHSRQGLDGEVEEPMTLDRFHELEEMVYGRTG